MKHCTNTECENCFYRKEFFDAAERKKSALEKELEHLKIESRMKEQELIARFGGVNRYERS